jgi:hypothetical protein
LELKFSSETNVNVKWLKDNAQVNPTFKRQIATSNNLTSLALSKIALSDQGEYLVELKNSKDTITCKTKLIVKGKK